MEPRYVTPKDGLGVAIIALGILALVMPWSSAVVGDLEFVPSEPYAILIGTVYVLGVLVALAGIAVLRLKTKDE